MATQLPEPQTAERAMDSSWQLYEQAKAEFMRIKPTASADEIEEAVRAILEMNHL